jgi:hypothetical protein
MRKRLEVEVIVNEIGDALEELASLPDGEGRMRDLSRAADLYIKEHPEARNTLLELIFMRIWSIEGEMDDWR